MPDLLAGTRVRGNDTPPSVTSAVVEQFSFDAATFGIDADSGTYSDCAVVFAASTTGRVLVLFGASATNSTSADTQMAPVVREGGTIGSGTEVVAASVDNMLSSPGDGSHVQMSGPPLLVTGLTPGATYNVRLEHRVTGGTGTLRRRHLIVAPAT